MTLRRHAFGTSILTASLLYCPEIVSMQFLKWLLLVFVVTFTNKITNEIK